MFVICMVESIMVKPISPVLAATECGVFVISLVRQKLFGSHFLEHGTVTDMYIICTDVRCSSLPAVYCVVVKQELLVLPWQLMAVLHSFVIMCSCMLFVKCDDFLYTASMASKLPTFQDFMWLFMWFYGNVPTFGDWRSSWIIVVFWMHLMLKTSLTVSFLCFVSNV